MQSLFAHVQQGDKDRGAILHEMYISYKQAAQKRQAIIEEIMALDVSTVELTDLYTRMSSGDGFKSATQVRLEGDFYHADIEAFSSQDDNNTFNRNEMTIIHKVASMAASNEARLAMVNEFIHENTTTNTMSYTA